MTDPETQPHLVPDVDASSDDTAVTSVPQSADHAAPHGERRRHPRTRLSTDAPRPTRPWLRAATLAAAAAIGALVGFGLVDGASLARLGVVTLRLRGLPEFVAPDRGATTAALLGGLHVALVSGLWGAGAGAVGRWLRARGTSAGARAVAVTALGLLLALVDGVLPTPLRLAAGALSGTERVLVGLLIAAAAWGASRLPDPSI